MAKTKKQYSPEFKLKVVIEVLKGEKTANGMKSGQSCINVAIKERVDE